MASLRHKDLIMCKSMTQSSIGGSNVIISSKIKSDVGMIILLSI